MCTPQATARRSRIAFDGLLILAVTLTLMSCRSDDNAPPPSLVDDEYHVLPRRDDMPSIMQAKLAHAQAVLEGLALGDFRQIEVNATALVEISQHADWLVHDTPSYASLSEHFRGAAQAMVAHAQRKDLEALSRDYGSLTGSCVACHRYLQSERPTLQMPGRVSLLR